MEGVDTPSLAIIGAGRAGSALAIAAHDAGYRVAAVASRRGEMAARLADTVGAQAVATPPEAAALADLTLLAVPDGAISTVAAIHRRVRDLAARSPASFTWARVSARS